MVQHEWFDGEDGIAAGYQTAFLREWRENAPAQVTIYIRNVRTAESVSLAYFATIRAAYAYAAHYEPEDATVIPVSRVMVHQRAQVPVQYRPAKWPESRW